MYLGVEQLTYRSLDLPQRPSVSTSHSPWKLFVFPLLRSIIFSLDRARHPFNLTFGTRDQRLFLELPRRLTSRWLTILWRERDCQKFRKVSKGGRRLIPIFVRRESLKKNKRLFVVFLAVNRRFDDSSKSQQSITDL